MEYEDLTCLKQMVETEEYLNDNGIDVNSNYLIECVEDLIAVEGSQNLLVEWIITDYITYYYPYHKEFNIKLGYDAIINLGIDDDGKNEELYIEKCSEVLDKSEDDIREMIK